MFRRDFLAFSETKVMIDFPMTAALKLVGGGGGIARRLLGNWK